MLFFVSLTFALGGFANAATPADPAAKKVTNTLCKGWSATDPKVKPFSISGQATDSDCSKAANRRYMSERMAMHNAAQNDGCDDGVVYVHDYGWKYQPRVKDSKGNCINYGTPENMGVGSSVWEYVEAFECPPEGPAWVNYTEIYTDDKGVQKCGINPSKDPNGCFRGTNALAAPLKHFDYTQTAANICVVMDNGKKCPFKNAGLAGVYVPNTTSAEKCTETPPPPDSNATAPTKCEQMGNGMEVCPADPNDKCTKTSIGSALAMKCQKSCGYMNGKFLCYSLPDTVKPDLEDPNAPKDEIRDPTKKTADMVKADFKEVQVGVESRLDSLITLAKNAQTLAEDNKSSEQLDEAKWSNQLLAAIDKNTAGALDELKKLNGAGVDGADFGEFKGEKNDWTKKNFTTVLVDAVEKFKSNELVASVNNFFDVSFAGQCPVWTVSVWVFDITIDQFCSPVFNGVLPYIRAVVLLMFGFISFRVAYE